MERSRPTIALLVAGWEARPRSGYTTRTHGLAAALAAIGEVTIVPVRAADAARSASASVPLPGGASARLGAAPSTPVDLAVADDVALVSALLAVPARRRVVAAQNVESELARALGSTAPDAGRRAGVLAVLETGALTRVDEIWAASEDDAAAFRAIGAKHAPRTVAAVRVVPNVVLHDAVPVRAPVPGRALFFGSLWYEPNRRAAAQVLETAERLAARAAPPIAWTIAGADPPDVLRAAAAAGRARVDVVGFADDLDDRLASAAVAVFPMTVGGGTMVKLLHALSAACPVLTTPVGARGLDGLRDAEHVVVRELGPSFDEAAAAMADHPATFAGLGERGRSFVEARYSLPALRRIVADAVDDLVG